VNLTGASLSTAPLRDAVLQDVDLRDYVAIGISPGPGLDRRSNSTSGAAAFEGRIWVADHIRGKLIAIVPRGEASPSTRDLEEFKYENSEFRDATDSFTFEAAAPEPTAL
jgi:hypothetical protein